MMLNSKCTVCHIQRFFHVCRFYLNCVICTIIIYFDEIKMFNQPIIFVTGNLHRNTCTLGWSSLQIETSVIKLGELCEVLVRWCRHQSVVEILTDHVFLVYGGAEGQLHIFFRQIQCHTDDFSSHNISYSRHNVPLLSYKIDLLSYRYDELLSHLYEIVYC